MSLAELKQRLLVECRQLDHSIVVAAISQWRRRLSACVRAHQSVASPSLCLCQGSRWTVSGVAVSLLVSGLMVDILITFCGVFIVQCVRIFEFGVLLIYCFVHCQNVTCLKRFTRYGHYAGEVEYIIISRLTVVS